ncbi:uncharacterized protein LOC144763387 [Lissotriton helveticus]
MIAFNKDRISCEQQLCSKETSKTDSEPVQDKEAQRLEPPLHLIPMSRIRVAHWSQRVPVSTSLLLPSHNHGIFSVVLGNHAALLAVPNLIIINHRQMRRLPSTNQRLAELSKDACVTSIRSMLPTGNFQSGRAVGRSQSICSNLRWLVRPDSAQVHFQEKPLGFHRVTHPCLHMGEEFGATSGRMDGPGIPAQERLCLI